MQPSLGDRAARRVTVSDLHRKKESGEPIVMITAYDYPSARMVEAADVDIVLVGDTAAMTVLGYASTQQISVDELLALTRAVRRGLQRPLLLGDLTYGTYEDSDELAIATARRYMEAGCDAVKMEGAGPITGRARALVAAGIPVMGHLGLMPQGTSSAAEFGVRGRTAGAAAEIVHGAELLEQAGCFALVLEAVPALVTELLVPRLSIPVIGIGAGPSTDGQVLVWHDVLGITEGTLPRFVERYADIRAVTIAAVKQYAMDVRSHAFPRPSHAYRIDPAELDALQVMLSTGERAMSAERGR